MQNYVELLLCAKLFAFLVPLNPQRKPHTNPIIITIFHWGPDSSYSQSVTWTQATPEPVLLPIDRHTSVTFLRTPKSSF